MFRKTRLATNWFTAWICSPPSRNSPAPKSRRTGLLMALTSPTCFWARRRLRAGSSYRFTSATGSSRQNTKIGKSVPLGIDVIRDSTGGAFGGGGALIWSAKRWLCRSMICPCLQSPHRTIRPVGARLVSQETMQRVADQFRGFSGRAPPLPILSKGLVLLGKIIDKGRPQF